MKICRQMGGSEWYPNRVMIIPKTETSEDVTQDGNYVVKVSITKYQAT